MAITPGATATADPSASMPDAGADAPDADGTTVCTISKNADGSYTVYAGDEPDDGAGEGMSADDDAAMGGDTGGAPAAPTPSGQHADSIGQALKAAMDILQADAQSAGGEGSADDQFASGFNENAAPTPVSVRRR